eukprot:IDg8949t1
MQLPFSKISHSLLNPVVAAYLSAYLSSVCCVKAHYIPGCHCTQYCAQQPELRFSLSLVLCSHSTKNAQAVVNKSPSVDFALQSCLRSSRLDCTLVLVHLNSDRRILRSATCARKTCEDVETFSFQQIVRLGADAVCDCTWRTLGEPWENGEKFEGVLAMFLASHEFTDKANEIPALKLKTVRERFKDIIKERRAAISGHHNRRNRRQTSQEAEKKTTRQAKETPLREAAEDIRFAALKRPVELSSQSDCDGRTLVKKTKTSNKSTRLYYNEADAEFRLIEEESKHRREQEAKRLSVEERRIVIEEQRLELDSKAQESQLELRKAETEEKKAMANMLQAILAKLK